jgi:hypothetical protein
MWYLGAREPSQTVLRATGETETTQESIQDWIELDKDPRFQLLTEEETTAVIFLFIFISNTYIIKFSICFLRYFFLSFRAIFASLI